MIGNIRHSQKIHTCTLCEEDIPANAMYMYARITPWDHPENECFMDYKTHLHCDELWKEYGGEFDWIFPEPYEWRERFNLGVV